MKEWLKKLWREEPAKVGVYIATYGSAVMTFVLMVIHDPSGAASWLEHAFHASPVAGAGHAAAPIIRSKVTPAWKDQKQNAKHR